MTDKMGKCFEQLLYTNVDILIKLKGKGLVSKIHSLKSDFATKFRKCKKIGKLNFKFELGLSFWTFVFDEVKTWASKFGL